MKKKNEKPLILSDLKRGVIVQSITTGMSFVIDSNYGDRVTAVTSVDITNIDEWRMIKQ